MFVVKANTRTHS